ncbi:MAG: hypothetical protein AB1324_06460 [Candidatus Micrarchaeota archaeon]
MNPLNGVYVIAVGIIAFAVAMMMLIAINDAIKKTLPDDSPAQEAFEQNDKVLGIFINFPDPTDMLAILSAIILILCGIKVGVGLFENDQGFRRW